MAKKGATGFGDNDAQILIPFGAGRFGLFGTDRIKRHLGARRVRGLRSPPRWARSSLRSAARTAFRRTSDDFNVKNQADILNTLNEATQTFTALLAGIAAVALLVGGIGIMTSC